MDEEEKAYLRKGATCEHQRLQIKWVEYLKQLEMYCPDCDNLLSYSAEDLRQIMARNFQRRAAEAGC